MWQPTYGNDTISRFLLFFLVLGSARRPVPVGGCYVLPCAACGSLPTATTHYVMTRQCTCTAPGWHHVEICRCWGVWLRGAFSSLSKVEGDPLISNGERATLFSLDMRESHSTLFTRESSSVPYRVDRGHILCSSNVKCDYLTSNEERAIFLLESKGHYLLVRTGPPASP